ncbi:MAG: multidrug resistance efflux pump [Patiriisocius sp.]|jgi:multidrug resistance efflux pump
MLFILTRGENSETFVFYGFSENKEQELNFDYDVKVVDIKVNSGQFVKQGDPLLEVMRTSGPLQLNEVENKLALLEIQKNAKCTELRAKIVSLYAERDEKLSNIEAEIISTQSSIDRNQALLKAIGEEVSDVSSLKGEDELDLEQLQKRKNAVDKPTDIKVTAIKSEIAAVEDAFSLEQAILSEEKSFYVSREDEQILKAPRDGIVGFITCSPGENYSSFSKLISLYDPHPVTVKGYVLESMITSIEINDSVRVSSSLNPDMVYGGKITGFGTRILEIPTRLTKIPELQIYGREVLISISSKNLLLQKEKVKIELIKGTNNMSLGLLIFNY